MRTSTVGAFLALSISTWLGCGGDTASSEQEQVQSTTIQILSVSDWHGQLDPLTTPTGNVGGAAVLSAYFQRERQANPNTLTLMAGDSFGATPPISAFFGDEPSVLAMNAMKIDADTLGNHNFDAGSDHLADLIDLADFPFVSANLKGVNDVVRCSAPAEDECVAKYTITKIGGVRVAIIGVTNQDAPALLPPGAMGSIKVTAPAYAANNARALARAQGAKVFIAIAHLGATGTGPDGKPTGPLIDFAKKLSGFQVVLGDHTNFNVSETINGALVVENRSAGATYAKVQLTLNRSSGRVTNRGVEFVTPLAEAVTPDAAIVALLEPYRVELAKLFDGRIATTDGVYFRGNNVERLREVPIGNLVADSMRVRYGTQLAFTNGGGIRASLPSSYVPKDPTLHRPAEGFDQTPPFDLVVGDAFGVLPFGNVVSTRTVSGAQVWALMEHSLSALPNAAGFFAQISGFRVTYDSRLPTGQRVVAITLTDGTPIPKDDDARFTMATSDFLDVGGDGYTMLLPSDGVSRDKMADVLLEHLRTLGELSPTTDGRLTDLGAAP
jgi:5'-nucleotidase